MAVRKRTNTTNKNSFKSYSEKYEDISPKYERRRSEPEPEKVSGTVERTENEDKKKPFFTKKRLAAGGLLVIGTLLGLGTAEYIGTHDRSGKKKGSDHRLEDHGEEDD